MVCFAGIAIFVVLMLLAFCIPGFDAFLIGALSAIGNAIGSLLWGIISSIGRGIGSLLWSLISAIVRGFGALLEIAGAAFASLLQALMVPLLIAAGVAFLFWMIRRTFFS